MKLLSLKLFLLSIISVYVSSCVNVSNEVESKLVELKNKTASLDSLINKEVDKVLTLDSIIIKESDKVKKLDTLINKTTSQLESISKKGSRILEKISN